MAIGDDKVRIALTLPKTLKVILDKKAKEDNRTTSNYIVNVLSTHIEKLEKDDD